VDQNWKHSNHAVHSLEHGSAVLCVSFNENKIVSGSADETIKGAVTSHPPYDVFFRDSKILIPSLLFLYHNSMGRQDQEVPPHVVRPCIYSQEPTIR